MNQTFTPATTLGRVPPHSIEAEEQLISACLLDGMDVLTRCVNAGIIPASFYVPANRLIFEKLLDLMSSGKEVEFHVLAEELKTTRQLDEIGGYAYLTRISDRIPTTAGASYFIEKVLELAQLRDAIRAATAIVENCYDYTGGGPREHLARDMERLSEALAVHAQARSWANAVGSAKGAALERMKPAKDRAADSWSVSWPWIDLDRYFLPIEPGELVVIAARPSVGKSSLARQLAWASVCAGLPTLFHTMEVTDSELATNLAANISGIRSRRDLDKLHDRDKEHLLASFDALANPLAPFAAIGEDDTVSAMLARALAFKNRHGLRLWIIDYLGLIGDCQNTRPGENTAAAIGRVTRALKRFATTQNVPIVLLCQLNRGAEVGTRKEGTGNEAEPKLLNLRDSGRIEEDANRVILLHRPISYEVAGATFRQDPNSSPRDEPTHYIEVIQAKGRNTGTARVALSFDRPTATFKNFTR